MNEHCALAVGESLPKTGAWILVSLRHQNPQIHFYSDRNVQSGVLSNL